MSMLNAYQKLSVPSVPSDVCWQTLAEEVGTSGECLRRKLAECAPGVLAQAAFVVGDCGAEDLVVLRGLGEQAPPCTVFVRRVTDGLILTFGRMCGRLLDGMPETESRKAHAETAATRVYISLAERAQK